MAAANTDDEAIQRRRQVVLAGHTGNHQIARFALHDEFDKIRCAALRSLAKLDELTTSDLADALADPAPTVRRTALELAAGRTEPSIVALLNDPEPTVAEHAAWACGERVATPEIVDRLAGLATGHDDALVREAAVAALGSLGDPGGRAAVLAATSDKPAVRRRAVLALIAFDGPEVDEAWANARTDPDRQVREAVEELLGPLD